MITVLKRSGGDVRLFEQPSKQQLHRNVHCMHAHILVHVVAVLFSLHIKSAVNTHTFRLEKW